MNYFSQYRTPIYGVFIFFIMIFHGSAIDNVDYSFGNSLFLILKTVLDNGSVGVDGFLFLSGIFLFFSFSNNPNTYEFIKKRILRLFIPLILIDGIIWFIDLFIIQHQRCAFVSNILLLKFWETGDSTVWYVSLLLVLYFMYPYIYGFLNASSNNQSRCIRGIALIFISLLSVYCFYRINTPLYDMTEIATTRITVFLTGCLFGKYVYEKKQVPFPIILLFIVLGILFFAILHIDILHGIFRRWLFLIGGIAWTFILAFVFHIIESLCVHHKSIIIKIFNVLGNSSLELYLSHIIVNKYYSLSPLYVDGCLYRYLMILVLATIIAIIANKISQKIMMDLS